MQIEVVKLEKMPKRHRYKPKIKVQKNSMP